MPNDNKILIGCDTIMEYIGISRPLFKEFVAKGMPVRLINNRWYAHTDNLDNYFKKITFYHEKNPPPEAE